MSVRLRLEPGSQLFLYTCVICGAAGLVDVDSRQLLVMLTLLT